MNGTIEILSLVLPLAFASILAISVLAALIPQAISNHKLNKATAKLPTHEDMKNCPNCGLIMWPPLRFRTDFPNPICRKKRAITTIGCSRCNIKVEIAVEIE